MNLSSKVEAKQLRKHTHVGFSRSSVVAPRFEESRNLLCDAVLEEIRFGLQVPRFAALVYPLRIRLVCPLGLRML